MRELLIAEMKRALQLLEADEKPFKWDWDVPHKAAELKQLMRLIRKHSVKLEQDERSY